MNAPVGIQLRDGGIVNYYIRPRLVREIVHIVERCHLGGLRDSPTSIGVFVDLSLKNINLRGSSTDADRWTWVIFSGTRTCSRMLSHETKRGEYSTDILRTITSALEARTNCSCTFYYPRRLLRLLVGPSTFDFEACPSRTRHT